MANPEPADTGAETLEGRRLAGEKKRLTEEKKNEKYMWWYLAYFLFGIHIVAFVMIYAVHHAT